jgi:hypothetical protein
MPSIPLVSAPIPPTTGNTAVRANPGMYDAVGAAGARLGQGFEAMGDLGTRIKHAQDYAAITKAGTAMQTAFEQFQTELNDPNNPENGDEKTWGPRWQERQAALKEQMAQDDSLKSLSPAARLHLDTQMQDWTKQTSTQIGHQATVRSLENAKGAVVADYNTKLRTGDIDGAVKAVQGAVPYGIIHPEEAGVLVASANRKADHYQASALIMQDPIAAEGALSEKDKDGKPTEFTHLDDDSRLQLTFEAHRRAMQLKQETAADLFERQQQGTPASPDEVNELVKQGRLSPTQAKQYLKPPKPEFDTDKFAGLMTDIAGYDPLKDTDRSQYAKLMARAAYDADIKGPAASDAVEMLKKKSDPKSVLNSPVAKDAVAAVDDAFKKGLYGKFTVTEPATAANGYTPKTVTDAKIYAQAKAEQLKTLDAVNRYIEQNPNASRAEVFKFISGLHEQAIATQGAKLFVK